LQQHLVACYKEVGQKEVDAGSKAGIATSGSTESEFLTMAASSAESNSILPLLRPQRTFALFAQYFYVFLCTSED